MNKNSKTSLNGKKKTIQTWVFLAIIGIYIIFNLYGMLDFTIFITAQAFEIGTILIIISQIISIILFSILFLEIYRVEKDVIRWTHISFGYFFLSSLIYFYPLFVANGDTFATAFSLLIMLGMILPIWIIAGIIWAWMFTHLIKAKKENLMDFQ